MKIKLFIIIILLQVRILNAQTAFLTSGKSLSNAQVLIDNTIGEPITFTVQNATIRLTQGFQQNNYNIPTGIKTAQLNVSIKTFPNPTVDKLQILLSKHYNSNLNLNLYDINGQLIWYGKMGNDVEMQNIDVSKFASGTYILQLTNETEELLNIYKIEKINK
jgi:hypothetical protein